MLNKLFGKKKQEEEILIAPLEGTRADTILTALGGKNNVGDLDNCATRLRVTVHDATHVSKAALKETGAKGVIVRGNGVQVIYGPEVTIIKAEVEEVMES